MSATPTPQETSRADLIPLVGWAAGFIALAIARATWLVVPQDMSAYLAAADVIGQGLSPYTNLEHSALYQGFPYLYYPGLRPLLELVHRMPLWSVLTLDTLWRGACGAWIMRAWVRRLNLAVPWQGLTLAWLCLDPFVTDLYVGNLELFMCAMWVGVVYLTDSPTSSYRDGLVACVIGALMIIKPMWGIPAAYAAALGRRWDVVAGLGVGAAAVLVGGAVWQADEIGAWWAMIAAVRAHWRAFDLGSAHPALAVVAACAWGVMGVKLWWQRREEAWLWAASSVLVWPRLGFYCYVLSVPLVLWCVRRHGRLVGALMAVPFSLAVSFTWPDATAWRLCIMYVATLVLSAMWLLDDRTERAV